MKRIDRLVWLGLIAVCFAVGIATPRIGTAQETSDFEIPQVTLINEQVRAVWADYDLTPSPRATDAEWCRRVHLDLIGRIPSVGELQGFLDSRETNKRMELVNSLLEGDEYTEEYARNWTTIWTNILIGRGGGLERRSLTSRRDAEVFRDSFARNKPYDRMVYELITATGSTVPGTADFNGATNFLAMKVNEEDGTLATAQTSKIFLGVQVQCTQCHNHPFNDWKQRKFWEMNAFFRQTRALRRFVPGTRDIESVQLVNEDYGGEGNSPEEAEIYYELRNGLLKAAYPVFLDGTQIARSGFVSDVERRTELGKLIVQSDLLEKAIANRLWAHFMGYGFTKPVNDMGPHNAPTHPELMDKLGAEIRQNSFNLKDAMRWMVLSEPYSLSSRTNSTNEKADDPQLGESPKFSRFYLRQMQAEHLYESLIVATEAHKTRGSYEEQESKKAEWLRQFTQVFGNDEGEEATTFNGTIPQALMMFNGDLVKRATSAEKGSFLWRIANSSMSNGQKINYLFMAALGRTPSKNEIVAANQLLRLREGDATLAMQDLWWAALNSNEFILNH